MATDPEADTVELPPVPTFGRGRPRQAAQRIHPRRIAAGHLKLYGQLRGWALADDGKTRARRLAGIALGALTAYRVGHQDPRALGAAAAAYGVAAWRAGRPVPPTRAELQRRFLLGVQHLIGDRPGIHLRELYDALQARPAAAHLDDARLRAVIDQCGLTVHRSIRIGTVTGLSGVKAADVNALLSPKEETTPPTGVDAGHTPPEGAVEPAERGVEPPVERAETA
ncbi:hypothetical protein [Streptomyces antimycoticus]|uniref:hypothetical protein n=1 Tax=Streptomyces antimycoticus TaxID=68175 RepID=UPI002570B1F9|nr:hypothetical protein [Streptomyces antimycoticus]WJD99757.1 hypothetical protein QR300_29330 [Streptomyces antimycoticus]